MGAVDPDDMSRGPAHPRRDPAVPPPASVALTFDAERVVRLVFVGCLGLELLFVVLDYHVNFGRLTDIGALRRMTNIAREDSLASWFGTTQTLLAGLTAWTIFLLVRAQGAPRWRKTGWALVAGFFTYVAIDDGAQVHERFGTVFRTLSEEADPSALAFFPSYAWQIFLGPIFAALGLGMAVFLWRELPDRVSFGLVFGALTCLALAIGLDFFEGLASDHPWNPYEAFGTRPPIEAWALDRFGVSGHDALTHFSRSVEEFLEMLGMTLFWVAFLRHLAAVTPELRMRLVR